jgi:hypothetical protein
MTPLSRGRKKLILLAISVLLIGYGVWQSKSESATPAQQGPAAFEQKPLQKSSGGPSVAPSALSHEVAPETTAEAQFREKAEQTMQGLPTQADLQKLSPAQVHYTPEIIKKAALDVADLAQNIDDNPKLAPQGLQFYRKCAEKADAPKSVRANCYAEHEDLLNKSGLGDESLEKDEKISDDIKALAKKF